MLRPFAAVVWLNGSYYCCGSLSRSGRSALYRLIVTGAGGLNTLLVIQDADALLVSELLVLFILFQHIQYALAGFNLVRIPFRRINTGAVGIFQFGVFFRRRRLVQATRPDAIMAISSIFFIVVLPEVRQAHARRAASENSERGDNHELHVALILEDVAVAAAPARDIGMVVVLGKVQFEQRALRPAFLHGIHGIQAIGRLFQAIVGS
jgi:hypothetical protein